MGHYTNHYNHGRIISLQLCKDITDAEDSLNQSEATSSSLVSAVEDSGNTRWLCSWLSSEMYQRLRKPYFTKRDTFCASRLAICLPGVAWCLFTTKGRSETSLLPGTLSHARILLWCMVRNITIIKRKCFFPKRFNIQKIIIKHRIYTKCKYTK